jgi:hypothetical protein
VKIHILYAQKRWKEQQRKVKEKKKQHHGKISTFPSTTSIFIRDLMTIWIIGYRSTVNLQTST